MLRFIFVSFAFLAFVFYEMSGGSEFNAEQLRQSRVEAPTAVETKQLEERRIAAAAQIAAEDVTRVSLSLTSVNDVLRPTNLRTQRARQTPKTEEPVGISEEDPVIILPSLIVDRAVITPVDFGSQATAEQVAPVVSGEFDVRSVTGSSVNVRGGPGTGFGVVNRLVRGDKVEILQNPGDGWVQLRPVGGGPVGWMAEFLLGDS